MTALEIVGLIGIIGGGVAPVMHLFQLDQKKAGKMFLRILPDIVSLLKDAADVPPNDDPQPAAK